MADDAGALLVRTGLVTDTALDEARSRVVNLGGTVGEQLVWTGAIGDDALTDFYRSRLLVPQVNPNTLARLSAKVVAAIPSDMAIELRAIPVALDNDNNLTVAMGDPSDRHAVDEIAFFTGTYVVRAVATQMQIAWCLAHYYGHVTALGQRLLEPGGAPYRGEVAVAEGLPRIKGLTGKVDAVRHRVVAPVTTPPPLARPATPEAGSGAAIAAPEEPAEPHDTDAIAAVEPEIDPAAPIESQDGDTESTPTQTPRARSISGEIRIQKPRAASVRPEVAPEDENEDDGPVITMVVGGDDDPTGPAMKPYRRKIKTDPPELAARAGEVDVDTGPVEKIELDEPRIVVEREALYHKHIRSLSGEIRAVRPAEETPRPMASVEIADDAAVIHDTGYADEDSAPILLNRRRGSEPTDETNAAPSDGEPEDEVVVLDDSRRKKPSTPPVTRHERRTQLGVGLFRGGRDTEQSLPAMLDDVTRLDHTAAPASDETTTDRHAAPAPAVDEDTNPRLLAPPPGKRAATPPPIPRAPTPKPLRAPTPAPRATTGDDDDDDERGNPTAVMSAVELDAAIPSRSSEVVPAHIENRRQINYDPVDDGWGPPDTTIPPPLLGAIPGTDDDDEPGTIPVSDVDSAPLMVAPPAPPETSRSNPHITLDPTNRGLVRAIEEATARAIDLIRVLEHAQGRDEVIAAMVGHLAESHRRAGFLSIRGGGDLSVFQIHPKPATLPAATLRLDRPSTLQDIVDTRLPYRGPMHDDASRTFLTSVLGACPPEILLVPVAVRERVVGVLFGEHRLRHTFDDQLALAARAAGMALERILKSRRG